MSLLTNYMHTDRSRQWKLESYVVNQDRIDFIMKTDTTLVTWFCQYSIDEAHPTQYKALNLSIFLDSFDG